MLPLAHAGLTTPAVAGPGCNEGLGLTRIVQQNRCGLFRLQGDSYAQFANLDKADGFPRHSDVAVRAAKRQADGKAVVSDHKLFENVLKNKSNRLGVPCCQVFSKVYLWVAGIESDVVGNARVTELVLGREAIKELLEELSATPKWCVANRCALTENHGEVNDNCLALIYNFNRY